MPQELTRTLSALIVERDTSVKRIASLETDLGHLMAMSDRSATLKKELKSAVSYLRYTIRVERADLRAVNNQIAAKQKPLI